MSRAPPANSLFVFIVVILLLGHLILWQVFGACSKNKYYFLLLLVFVFAYLKFWGEVGARGYCIDGTVTNVIELVLYSIKGTDMMISKLSPSQFGYEASQTRWNEEQSARIQRLQRCLGFVLLS